ncbi:hypothetical protein [Pseudonocardia sp.]|uniref:hypothetical protein n=2 Tax=Pseudonocardia sp. TaxID=60912 RepID=UPI003D09C7E3
MRGREERGRGAGTVGDEQGQAGGDGVGYGVGRVRMSGFSRVFGPRQPMPIQVRWQDGEPVEFSRRPVRRGPRYLVTDVRERWIEESPWPFPSPMPIGGDRLRCWRVTARSAEEPHAPETEFVLRMRAGPGVWDLVRVPK